MSQYGQILRLLLEATQPTNNESICDDLVPVGVSNRHAHLSQNDVDRLFGIGYQLTSIKELSQPGQFACKETVTVCGPKGVIEKIRIIGPVRKETQVEILAGDSFKLGIKTNLRLSGDLKGTNPITIIGTNGSVEIPEGVIVAKRHIHMASHHAEKFDVYDGEVVSVKVDGDRGGLYGNVVVRVIKDSTLELHVDTEEANAMSITSATKVKIVKSDK